MVTMTASRKRWVLLLGMIGVLLAAASLVPDDEDPLARSAAQVAAVLVPLGIELVCNRWQRGRDRDRALETLRERLRPVSAPLPAGLREGLDDASYRVSPYWGRSALHDQLDAIRGRPGLNVVLVTGPAWTGKTRLLTEWALTLPTEVLAGWVRPDTVDIVVAEGRDLGVPLVLLSPGVDAEKVLNAIDGGSGSITLLLEARDASQLRVLSSDSQAERLAAAATIVTVDSPGGPTDMVFRFGQMVQEYAKVAGIPSPPRTPRLPRARVSGPIGLLSALALGAVRWFV